MSAKPAQIETNMVPTHTPSDGPIFKNAGGHWDNMPKRLAIQKMVQAGPMCVAHAYGNQTRAEFCDSDSCPATANYHPKCAYLGVRRSPRIRGVLPGPRSDQSHQQPQQLQLPGWTPSGPGWFPSTTMRGRRPTCCHTWSHGGGTCLCAKPLWVA